MFSIKNSWVYNNIHNVTVVNLFTFILRQPEDNKYIITCG